MLGIKKLLMLVAIMAPIVLFVACGPANSVRETNIVPLAIDSDLLADGQVGIAYSQILKSSGGSGTYTWTISDGSLPGGLSLLANNGSINGMPNIAGTSKFTVQISDGINTATRFLSIKVKDTLKPIFIGTTSLATGQVGIPYYREVDVSGGSGSYTWSISNGALSDGLAFDTKTGVISGTPKTAGIFYFTVKIDDSAGASRDQSLSLTVNPVPVISTTALPDGKVGSSYDQVIEVTGGTSPYVWSVLSGSIPDGLTFDTTYVDIYGIPKTAGTFNFTIQVKDSLGAVANQNLLFIITAG